MEARSEIYNPIISRLKSQNEIMSLENWRRGAFLKSERNVANYQNIKIQNYDIKLQACIGVYSKSKVSLEM